MGVSVPLTLALFKSQLYFHFMDEADRGAIDRNEKSQVKIHFLDFLKFQIESIFIIEKMWKY